MIKDTGVRIKGTSLNNYHILFAISGGIAATESIKIARELRRFQAKVTILMSKEAEKIITPLAVSWASDSDIITDWDPKMKQLDKYDAILVAPATRNTISKHIHGIMDSPMMMALSSARGSKSTLLFVPSMHKDLFDDPVTSDLISKLIEEGSEVLLEEENEGKIKQPDPVKIVAKLCNLINSKLPNRKKIAITLGANRAEIDSIRSIINTSSGETGWLLSEYLYRHGHDITCIVGHTTANPSFELTNIEYCQSPTKMLESCFSLASSEDPPQAWIHVAAVLDYYPIPEVGKKSSGVDEWNIKLITGPKHIPKLSPLVNGTIRIGFKLETNVSNEKLIENASKLLNNYNLNAVIGNIKEHVQDENLPRGIMVLPDGITKILQNNLDMCSNIESIISN